MIETAIHPETCLGCGQHAPAGELSDELCRVCRAKLEQYEAAHAEIRDELATTLTAWLEKRRPQIPNADQVLEEFMEAEWPSVRAEITRRLTGSASPRSAEGGADAT